jgi:hypothetical protein
MFSKQQFFIALLILLGLVFTAGYFVGRWSKQCPAIINETKSSDTTTNYVPISGGGGSPLTVITYPKNATIPNNNQIENKRELCLKPSTKLIHDTIFKEYPTFASVDTLRNDSLFVAITDTGNCNGIITRHSVFGGKIKEKTINNTITKVIEKPIPIFQLNGGVQSSFSNQWQVREIGPILQVQLKQKFTVGYTYFVNSQTHNISLLTKIK